MPHNPTQDQPDSPQEPTPLDLPAGFLPLSSLYLYIAGACNLACRHCWISPTFNPQGGGQFVSLAHVAKAVREGKPLGLNSVKLTGGEPLLHPQFRELITLLHEAELDITIETNGTLIDDDMATFLKEKGVSFISVSLDGATPEVHEALRVVRGSFDKAVNGIRFLGKAGFNPQVICTLHQGNAYQLGAMIDLAAQLGCGSLKFNLVQSSGRGDHFIAGAGFSVQEVLDLYKSLERDHLPTSKLPVFFDLPIAFHSIRRLTYDPLGSCHILNILGMLAEGELALCGIGTTVPELVYGNIGVDDLRTVWCDSPGLKYLRQVIPSQLEGICGRCIHRDLCLGACVANNYHLSGRLQAAYQFCQAAEDMSLFPNSRMV